MLYNIVDDVPIFGKIIDIIAVPSFLFVLQPLIGDSFNTHFNSYDINMLDNDYKYIICNHDSLIDYHSLSTHKCFSNTLSSHFCICLKYNVS